MFWQSQLSYRRGVLYHEWKAAAQSNFLDVLTTSTLPFFQSDEKEVILQALYYATNVFEYSPTPTKEGEQPSPVAGILSH